MEKGELENPELAESLFSPVSPEDGAEAVLPPDVPPPFTNEVLLNLREIARSQGGLSRAKTVLSEGDVPFGTSKEEKQFVAERIRSGDEGASRKSSLERVMAAAEQDLPQERENELRHEKKGEAVVPLAAMAVSVGQVLADAGDSFFPKLQAVTDDKSNNHLSQSSRVPLSRRELYKRAIVLGFLSGLSVLVILGIVIIIR